MPPRKRQAPSTPQTAAAGGRRRSQRIGSSGKKSQYFEADSDEGDRGSEDGRAAKRAKRASAGRRRKAESDSEDEYGHTEEDAGTADDDDDDEEEEEEQREQRPKGKKSGTKAVAPRKREDNKDEDEDDDDDDDDEDGPTVTFTPWKKLRGDGGVPYADDRVHANTMQFLKDLKANNKRSWLKENDKEYRRSLEDWNSYVKMLTDVIIAADDTIPELPVKHLVFRIYRDVRFSKDQTPYKPHYSAAWSRTGRKGPWACYYVHVEPGACFVAGGLWHPAADALGKLRASIDDRPIRWGRILSEERFRAAFLPTALPGDPAAAKRAFADRNKEGALKKGPLGWDLDHPDIELLKLRNFTVSKKIPDSFLTDAGGQARVGELIATMVDFVTNLNHWTLPDLDSAAESDGIDA